MDRVLNIDGINRMPWPRKRRSQSYPGGVQTSSTGGFHRNQRGFA